MPNQTCTICQKTGPVLMPLRYAIVPDTITQQLPAWATPQTAFPALSGYHYALRTVRQGFIYVFYNTGALPENAGFDWECWSMAENGDLYYHGTTGLGAQPVFNPLPCGRPVHKATSLEHMALSEKALKYDTWVAFSHAPWEAEALDLYTRDADARAKRMQNITPAEWNSHILAQENGLVQASEAALNTVLDYQTTPPILLRDEERPTYRVSSFIDGQYGFYQESVNPHTTFHAWSRQRAGRAERSMQAMHSRCQASSGKAISPLMLALQDPVGITHELAHWGDSLALAHQCYLDELSVEFATWRNINGVKSQVKQMTTAQQAEYAKAHGEDDLQLLYRTMGGTYSRGQIKHFYNEGNAWARNQGIAYDWSTYTAKLVPGKLAQFTDAYDRLCKELDKQTRALTGLRIDWLRDSRFITCIQDHNSSRVEDNLYYREIVGYAVASLNIVPAGRQLIQTWINAYSTKDKTNLF
ncbi:T6SS effector BTH_I2691 family protein [Pseudescherichia sp.]|uniref:T6SS effector BTH_I2691 family protein n=1 Tax=Pseudescherichia sp. TaxID=2055881 RepID=UPI0028A01CF8|nr:T6SS effector BTH_I2691 family protein [Pseudescherichia sp.]